GGRAPRAGGREPAGRRRATAGRRRAPIRHGPPQYLVAPPRTAARSVAQTRAPPPPRRLVLGLRVAAQLSASWPIIELVFETMSRGSRGPAGWAVFRGV